GNNLNHSFWFAVGQNSSKLSVIGDKAFFHSSIMKSTSGEGKGLAFWDRTNKRAVGEGTSNSVLLVFPNLTYVGDRTFMNNPDLTGALLTPQYVTIGQRAFANTKLTDFYFRWDPYATSTGSTVNSSVIGSSSTFVNAKKRAYTHNTDLATLNKFNGYSSLYSIINNGSNGLIALWSKFFSDISFANFNFDDWKAEVGNDTPKQPTLAPELSYGKNNGFKSLDVKNDIDIDTANYIKTETKWTTTNKVAEETVTFGYKNRNYVDYIFVVDNSPSMDRASYNSAYNGKNQAGYTSDIAKPYEGTYNVSKMMNAYSQIYDISKQVLNSKSDNTVSVISFRGKDNNALEASSKFLVPDGTSLSNISNAAMKKSDDVYNALFATDNGYEDNNDGVTNYSSGLSRAYQLINSLKNDTRTKVVIMITDGNPTYYNGTKAVSAGTTGVGDTQVNGIDWANAIRGNTSIKYTVHSYTKSSYTDSSKYDATTESVYGLNSEIFGLIVGSENTSAMISVTNAKSKVFFSSTMEDVGSALNNIIEEVVAEDYEVVIPLDNNFNLKTKNSGTLAVSDFALKKDGKVLNTSSSKENSTYYVKYSDNCRISYNQNINSIIWDFTVRSLDDVLAPYATYTLTFSLDYNGKGGEYTTGGKTYAAVNDNSSDTSKSSVSSTETDMIRIYNQSVRNGNVSGTSGAYVILYKGDGSKILSNYAPPIYLPIETGELQILKKVSTANGTTETNTGRSLAGAKFTLYDSSYKEVYFTTNSGNAQFYYYNASSGSSTLTSRSDFIYLYSLPYGTYYLCETAFPEETDYTYTSSSLNSTMAITLPNGSIVDVMKVVIDDTNPKGRVEYYNKAIPKAYGTIYGTKRIMTGSTTHPSKELGGATMGLFETFGDAQNRTNCIATAISDNSGKYTFSLEKLKANTSYYVREIKAPDGVQLVNIIQTSNITGFYT
ncbi:MAG: VWA domain-containing protein, partial [Ruminococcus sp.]|nr:VWA domain-containing protein [Ruminococcus sp.]